MALMVGSLTLMALGAGAQTKTTSQRKAATAAAKPAPIYAPARQEVDAGRITKGKTARYEFVIRNKGNAPLTLQVKPTCDCTVATFDPVIPPGGQGRIVADLRTEELSGTVTKTLSVRTNDPKHPAAGLYMLATIVSIADVEPSDNFPLPLNADGPTETTLTVRFQKDETAEIREVVSTVPAVQPRLEPLATTDGRRTYSLKITVGPNMPYGAVPARVILRTTSTLQPELRILIRCEKGIVVSPSSLYMGTLPTKPKEPVTRFVTLRRHTGDFRVLRVTCTDPNLAPELVRLQGTIGWRITVRYKGGWPEGMVRQALIVETDDKRQPRIVIPVLARVGGSVDGL